jgi:hypothetical protein
LRDARFLFHSGAGFAVAIGAEEDDAVGVAGGQQHAVGFFAAEHGFLEVVDHDDLAADELLGGVVGANARYDLLLFVADLDLEEHEFVGVGMFAGGRNGGDAEVDLGKVVVSDFGFHGGVLAIGENGRGRLRLCNADGTSIGGFCQRGEGLKEAAKGVMLEASANSA